MADALAIMESLRAGRIQPDHAVVLLMYEARWPVEAAERGVYGPRDMQAMRPVPEPRPCGCEDEAEPGSEAPDPVGTIEDLIGALQLQADGLENVAAELKAETATKTAGQLVADEGDERSGARTVDYPYPVGVVAEPCSGCGIVGPHYCHAASVADAERALLLAIQYYGIDHENVREAERALRAATNHHTGEQLIVNDEPTQ